MEFVCELLTNFVETISYPTDLLLPTRERMGADPVRGKGPEISC